MLLPLLSGRAGAQTPSAPPNTADAYILLGLLKVDVMGGGVVFQSGSVGVNGTSGQGPGALTANGPIDLSPQDGVIAADSVLFNHQPSTPSTCAAVFANSSSGVSPPCAPPQKVTLPLVKDLGKSSVCDLPAGFPKCTPSSTDVTVAAGTEMTLPPGTYRNLIVNGRLVLQGGDYVFSSVNANAGSMVTTTAPSTLCVSDRFNVGSAATINASGMPADLHVIVQGLGVNVQGSPTTLVFTDGAADAHADAPRATRQCRFVTPLLATRSLTPATTVVAQVCALTMNALMQVSNAGLFGTFVGWAIQAQNVTGGLAPPTPPTTVPSTTSTTTTSSTSTSTSIIPTTTTSTTSSSTSSTTSSSTSTTSSSTTSTTSTSTSTTSSSTTSTTSTSTSSTTSTSTSSTTSSTTTTTTGETPTTTSSTTTTTTTTSTTSSTSSTTTTTTTTSTTSSTSSTTTTTSTVPPTTTGPATTTTSSSTSSSVIAPSTSTSARSSTTSSSTSTSTPVSSTTSTSQPVCDVLQVTNIKFKPRKGGHGKGRLVVRGVLADSGWADVDPRDANVSLGLQMHGEDPACCTVDSQYWMKNFPTNFGFWDMHKAICPPLADATLIVRRRGSAGFKIVAPGVEVTEDMLTNVQLGVLIGTHCSVGSFSTSGLRRKGGALVYP